MVGKAQCGILLLDDLRRWKKKKKLYTSDGLMTEDLVGLLNSFL